MEKKTLCICIWGYFEATIKWKLWVREKKRRRWKVSCITRQEIRSERNISIVLEAGSRRDRDVTARLIRAGGKERVRRYHLLFLITLMSLNVFVFIHQLKGCGGPAAKEWLRFFFFH